MLNPDGTPNTPFVVRDCQKTCAYYQWIQGTSMASPHAVGVAALIISKFDKNHKGDFSLDPATTEQILRDSATETPCPVPALHSYADKLRPPSFDALCETGRPQRLLRRRDRGRPEGGREDQEALGAKAPRSRQSEGARPGPLGHRLRVAWFSR